MTRVGWLHDNPGGYVGGAELTMREFANTAPKGVEIVEGATSDCERYVIGNGDFPDRPSGFRYLHDMRGGYTSKDVLIFCSPLQRSRYGEQGEVIPPALDLDRFRAQVNGHREGAVALAQWQNPGKGYRQVGEWAQANESVTVIGPGPFKPQGPKIVDGGELEPDEVAAALHGFETFIHIPTVVEPFGRAVVEAWAAGCKVITNRLVGARHFIEKDPEALESAASEFWGLVLA